MLVQLNAKGQLTVPQSIRRQLGLKPGDVLELETRGETIVVRPCATDVPVVRSIAARALGALEGLGHLGGDALLDTEALYDGP